MSKIDPFVQKIVWTLLSAGLAVAGAQFGVGTGTEQLLMLLAGAGVGGAWIPQPRHKP
jgi:hypothetical protein